MRTRWALRLLVVWVGNCLGLALAAAVLPAVAYHGGVGTLLLAGAILALVNFAVRPILIFFTLPAVIVTLGAAVLLINAATLWLTSEVVAGLELGGFWSTFAAALIVSLVNLVLRPWRDAARRSGRRDRRTREWLTREWRRRDWRGPGS